MDPIAGQSLLHLRACNGECGAEHQDLPAWVAAAHPPERVGEVAPQPPGEEHLNLDAAPAQGAHGEDVAGNRIPEILHPVVVAEAGPEAFLRQGVALERRGIHLQGPLPNALAAKDHGHPLLPGVVDVKDTLLGALPTDIALGLPRDEDLAIQQLGQALLCACLLGGALQLAALVYWLLPALRALKNEPHHGPAPSRRPTSAGSCGWCGRF